MWKGENWEDFIEEAKYLPTFDGDQDLGQQEKILQAE